MKYKSSKYSTNDVKMFALEVFDYLNGKINKKVPARGIKFIKDRDVEFSFDSKSNPDIYTATVFTNTLYINPNSVIDMDRLNVVHAGKHMTYEEFTGFIIQIVAHELSHLDQDIDQYRFSDPNSTDYMYMIEITNELHTYKWIKSHYRKMVKIFDVKFDYKWAFDRSSYLHMNDSMGYGYKETDYIAVRDIHTKVFNELDMIFAAQMQPLLQEGLERGYRDLEILVMKEKNIDSGVYDDIISVGSIDVLLTEESRIYSLWEVIRKLMVRNYKRYKVGVSCEKKESTITLHIIERTKPLPWSDTTPMMVGVIRLDSSDDGDPNYDGSWMKKYYTE